MLSYLITVSLYVIELIRRTRTVFGARDFAVSSAVVWDSLPAEPGVSSLTVAAFARHLTESSLVFECELAHLMTFYLALYKYAHYYWATVCKTVCPMLSDRCLSVCLSVLSVCL